jgi:hypothetical protein
MSHKREPVSANWEDREFVQTMQIGILEIVKQLNRIDREVRTPSCCPCVHPVPAATANAPLA